MIIDDNQDLLDLMRETLMERGFVVTAYSDPLVFLAEVEDRHFDIVLLDWHMPHCSGAEVLHRLADATRRPPLPVIVLSGATPELPEASPPGLRLLEPLPKPFRMQTLADVVTQALATAL